MCVSVRVRVSVCFEPRTLDSLGLASVGHRADDGCALENLLHRHRDGLGRHRVEGGEPPLPELRRHANTDKSEQVAVTLSVKSHDT